MIRLGVLASGRGSNLQRILEAERSGELDAEVVVVVSDSDTAPALRHAREHGKAALFVDPGSKRARLRPEVEREYVAALRSHGVQWVVLAGFLRLVGRDFLGAYGGRTINIHPSLLPSFPGLSAQQQALDAGARLSGCTVHLVDSGMDTGPILAQRAVPVRGNDVESDLAERILAEEHQVLVETLQRIATVGFDVQGRRVVWKDEL